MSLYERPLTYLAGLAAGFVQHVEQEAHLARQTKLALTQVVLHSTAHGLQEVEHLQRDAVIMMVVVVLVWE